MLMDIKIANYSGIIYRITEHIHNHVDFLTEKMAKRYWFDDKNGESDNGKFCRSIFFNQIR